MRAAAPVEPETESAAATRPVTGRPAGARTTPWPAPAGRPRRAATTLLAGFVLASTPACVPDGGRVDRTRADYLAVLAAEDARPQSGPRLDLLRASTAHPDPLVRRAAVRALGRLEDPGHRQTILPLLGDAAASVRAAAALALAQSAHGRDGDAVLRPLLDRVAAESDAAARGALARAIGRLRLSPAARERAIDAVVALGGRLGGGDEGEAPTETLVGVALGLQALLSAGEAAGIDARLASRLEELASHRRDVPDDLEAARVRALALSALGSSRRLSLQLVERGLDDPDGEVRRQAVRHLDAVVPSRRTALLRRALADPADRVAIEALRHLAAGTRTEAACSLLVQAARAPGTGAAPSPSGSRAEASGPVAPAAGERARSPTAAQPTSPAVRMEALAALAAPCPGLGALAALRATAEALHASGVTWHEPVQALRSLAGLDPEEAAQLLPAYAEHESPFVRAHAARVATMLRDGRALGALSVDESANVRTAAVEGLFELQGHAIDPILHAQLASDDPWLLVTAAGLLEGSPEPEVTAAAALAAFERISGARRETWRDPRRALLALVAAAAGPGGAARGSDLGPASADRDALNLADRLRPHLADYDPFVAADVAAILGAGGGEPHEPAPELLPRAPLPGIDELDELERTTVTLHVRGLGPIVIRPLPHAALTNAARFVRLARRGYYDGLTFHRHAPNFVIQGGSPGANEYAGDALYSRDEIEHPHWRGTVGLSTRGRDTGDAQIFINLVHNVRLDADYTVFAEVVGGIEVVDRVLEGAVIERAEVRVEPRPTP